MNPTSWQWKNDCLPPQDVFRSHHSLKEFIDGWAKACGYAFVIGRSKKEKSGRRTITYTCDRACKPPDPTLPRVRRTSTRGTGCQFSIVAKECADGTWNLKHRDDQYHHHNHPPSPHPSAHPANRKLDNDQKAAISHLLSTRIPAKDIQSYMRERGILKYTTRKDIQNSVAATRRELCEGQSAIHALINQLDNEGFWNRLRFDDKGRIISVLFAHPQSLEYLQAYPDVLLLDCTYNTNKYNMPLLDIIGVDACNRSFCIAFALLSGEAEEDYLWALDRLKSIYEAAHASLPAVILTDRCLACINAVEAVFTTSISLLCLWHANKAVLAHCLPIFAMQEKLLANLSSNSLTDEEQSSRWKDFYNHWHNIINSPTEAAFNERVKAFEDKYVNNHVEEVAYIKEVWLAPYKERLVKAWVDNIPISAIRLRPVLKGFTAL